MEIFGKKVKLRAVEEKDSEILRKLINDPYVESKVGGWSFPVSINQQIEWIKNLKNRNDSLNLSIVELEDSSDICIGMANLVNIDWKNKSAFTGVKLTDSKRGKGIGKDVVVSIMKYAFDELNLNRLESSIIETNDSSKKLYLEKCGWKLEGIKKEAIYKNGKYNDNLILGITRKEYIEYLRKEEKIKNEKNI